MAVIINFLMITMLSPPSVYCLTNSATLPTRLLKVNMAPFLFKLLNRSLTFGVVPTAFKLVYITPLLKKVDLDPADARSYRPISTVLRQIRSISDPSIGLTQWCICSSCHWSFYGCTMVVRRWPAFLHVS